MYEKVKIRTPMLELDYMLNDGNPWEEWIIRILGVVVETLLVWGITSILQPLQLLK